MINEFCSDETVLLEETGRLKIMKGAVLPPQHIMELLCNSLEEMPSGIQLVLSAPPEDANDHPSDTVLYATLSHTSGALYDMGEHPHSFPKELTLLAHQWTNRNILRYEMNKANFDYTLDNWQRFIYRKRMVISPFRAN